MTDTSQHFREPPHVHKQDGTARQVGFELEFSGLSLDQAAACVQTALGGTLTRDSAAARSVTLGDDSRYSVTIDWAYLNRTASRHAADAEHPEWLESLSSTAALVVPIEIVCPPLPVKKLAPLNTLVRVLREAGATGTDDSLMAAYGVHINVEPPSLQAPTLHAYLRAFALLQWWLFDAHAVDTTRRLSPYIDSYPERYLTELLQPEPPSLEALRHQYLEHNATRNRALDMLPLLAMFDAADVQEAVNDSRINARPALHYRLPNCEFDNLDRTLTNPWNIWCTVEELANRPQELALLSDHYLSFVRPVIGLDQNAWKKHTTTWLQDQEWA